MFLLMGLVMMYVWVDVLRPFDFSKKTEEVGVNFGGGISLLWKYGGLAYIDICRSVACGSKCVNEERKQGHTIVTMPTLVLAPCVVIIIPSEGLSWSCRI